MLPRDEVCAAFASSMDAISITRVDDGVYVEVNQGFSEHPVTCRGDRGVASTLDSGSPPDRARMIERLQADGLVTEFEHSSATRTAGPSRLCVRA
jgi:hypothetical protein